MCLCLLPLRMHLSVDSQGFILAGKMGCRSSSAKVPQLGTSDFVLGSSREMATSSQERDLC